MTDAASNRLTRRHSLVQSLLHFVDHDNGIIDQQPQGKDLSGHRQLMRGNAEKRLPANTISDDKGNVNLTINADLKPIISNNYFRCDCPVAGSDQGAIFYFPSISRS